MEKRDGQMITNSYSDVRPATDDDFCVHLEHVDFCYPYVWYKCGKGLVEGSFGPITMVDCAYRGCPEFRAGGTAWREPPAHWKRPYQEKYTQRIRGNNLLHIEMKGEEPMENVNSDKEPEPQTWEEALDIVLANLRDIMIRKHHDYGPDNILALGGKGVFVRGWDKVNRLKRLVWENKEALVRDETSIDTWRDLSNYGIIAEMLSSGWWELPLSFEKDEQE